MAPELAMEDATRGALTLPAAAVSDLPAAVSSAAFEASLRGLYGSRAAAPSVGYEVHTRNDIRSSLIRTTNCLLNRLAIMAIIRSKGHLEIL